MGQRNHGRHPRRSRGQTSRSRPGSHRGHGGKPRLRRQYPRPRRSRHGFGNPETTNRETQERNFRIIGSPIRSQGVPRGQDRLWPATRLRQGHSRSHGGVHFLCCRRRVLCAHRRRPARTGVRAHRFPGRVHGNPVRLGSRGTLLPFRRDEGLSRPRLQGTDGDDDRNRARDQSETRYRKVENRLCGDHEQPQPVLSEEIRCGRSGKHAVRCAGCVANATANRRFLVVLATALDWVVCVELASLLVSPTFFKL
mmetsp:Transcript_8387/g.17451  ORF Transcript_8387/g.17451 Transcript_8387/m.17451 type:complete len:253 (+) Transcript_8387:392-1150(+)